ncbi:MAG: deoxyribose-phosphate aldolase [Robiginitalea sp.]|jgi:hypothetical protein
MMKYYWILVVGLLLSCQEKSSDTTDPQEIVDKAIEASGGTLYENSELRFVFREREYIAVRENGRRVLMRITQTDTARLVDVRRGGQFERIIDGIPQILPDTTLQSLSEAVNSVHYFASLPYGLNDRAVNKEYLGRGKIGDSEYHKIRVTFDQQGGGTDYEDIFVYWFDVESFLPEYLAYQYQTNGGGKRFRQAYNPRRVGGIRFVDYRNFKYEGPLPVAALDSLFSLGELQLLSRIELEDIHVNPGNYN